jgi:hypothetical protein
MGDKGKKDKGKKEQQKKAKLNPKEKRKLKKEKKNKQLPSGIRSPFDRLETNKFQSFCTASSGKCGVKVSFAIHGV